MENNTLERSTVTNYLLTTLLVILILYLGKTLFIPLFLGLLVAIVMYPSCRWLENRGLNKILSISISLSIVGVIFTLLIVLLVWQLILFSTDVPTIVHKAESAIIQFQDWILYKTSLNLNLSTYQGSNILDHLGSIINATFQSTVTTLFFLFITPVYSALFLYHRKIFIQYLKMVTPEKYKHELDIIIQQTIHTYFNYIKGMVLVYIIVGILNSLGLFFLGVNHAILFGMLCAIMTIIPYIGIFLSALLPISVVWMDTGNIWYPLGVIVVFSFVQYLEANVIFPIVVGKQLKVSTFAMLVSFVIGGIIWGVVGMILIIPFVAILKIISDHIEDWKPINLLLTRK